MSHPLVEKAKMELEQAQSQLEAALRAWTPVFRSYGGLHSH